MNENRGNDVFPIAYKAQKRSSFGGNMHCEITKKELEQWYVQQKLSCNKISTLLNLRFSAVKRLLEKNGISLRSSKSEEGKLTWHPVKYDIPKDKLEDSYWQKKLSPYQIAKTYGCSPSCIFGKMKKYNIPLRTLKEGIMLSIPRRSKTLAISINKHKKSNFDGSNIDKAYLIGFRLGDLWVGKNKYGETITVSSGTTKEAQLVLMRSLFEKYGKISEYQLKTGCTQFNCYLNMSFDFLLPKEDKIPEWILSDDSLFLAFFGGYVDAEGHFGLDRVFAEFAVGSYDINILSSISTRLNELNINCNQPRLQVNAGFIDKRGVKWHKNYYRLKISKKSELLKLIQSLKPFIKHGKRFNDLLRAEANIIERNKSV